MQCREENLSRLTEFVRLTCFSEMAPFDITIRTPAGVQLVRVRKGFSLFGAKIEILSDHDQTIGWFKRRSIFLSNPHRLVVMDANNSALFRVEPKKDVRDYFFFKGNLELAQIHKKWAGTVKEFFTTADHYKLEISENVVPGSVVRRLAIAAVICIDLSFFNE